MRITTIAAIALCSLPVVAQAQTPATAPAKPAATTPAVTGWLDLGARGSSIDGDGARYERYRDLGDGAFLETFRLNGQRGGWFFDAGADHAGRRDQRYMLSAVRPGKLKLSFLWDQIPMLMSRTTQTLFNFTSPGVLTIDDALQAQVQASAANLATVVQNNAHVFETSSKRHIAEGRMQYIATPTLTLQANVKRQNRDGVIPFGGSFGHGNVAETPAPVQHTLTDVDAGAEFSKNRLLLRFGAAHSSFHNDVTSLTFDNPWRAVDSTSGGSAGRIGLAPSNSMFNVNGTASVKLPGRSRATAYFSMGQLKDAGEPLLPFTVNTALAVIPLPRPTVQGEAHTSAMNFTFTSHPSRYLDFSARYRSYDYDNRTPVFDITQRVAYDNAVSNAINETEPFGVKRHTFDADARVIPTGVLTAGVGFSQIKEDRTHRIFESTTENITRATVDAISTRWFSLRAKFEHGEKRGDLVDDVVAELTAIGEQPGMRHFDLADRDRNRVTFIGTVSPVDSVTFTASFAKGHDDYLQSLFGLRDNRHRIFGAGVDVQAGENAGFGVSYSHELYSSLSRSRQANPGVQFTDESRNWATDGSDRVHSAMANAEVLKIGGKLDLKFSADWSRARSLYNYITGPVEDRTLPEESTVIASTLPAPKQLPLVRSQLTRTTLDGVYNFTSRIGIGLSYWFEKYQVADFTLDAQAIPRIDLPGALLIGYQYLPYTAHTVWTRLVYRW